MTRAISRGAVACVAVAGLLALPQRVAADRSESRYHEFEDAVLAKVSAVAQLGDTEKGERELHASQKAESFAVSAAATSASPTTTGPSYSPAAVMDVKSESGPTPNPEPATILLIGAGTAGVAYWRRRQGRSS